MGSTVVHKLQGKEVRYYGINNCRPVTVDLSSGCHIEKIIFIMLAPSK